MEQTTEKVKLRPTQEGLFGSLFWEVVINDLFE